MANGRCRLHGGKSEGRPPVTGRRSKYLKNIRLAERLNEALGDPELLNQAENLATIEALIASRMEELGAESSAELWRSANAALDDLQEAIHAGKTKAVREAIDTLSSILRNGLGHEKRIQDVRSLIQEQASVARVEITRLEKRDQFIAAREMGVVLKVILDIIRDEVKETKSRQRIAARLAAAFCSGSL